MIHQVATQRSSGEWLGELMVDALAERDERVVGITVEINNEGRLWIVHIDTIDNRTFTGKATTMLDAVIDAALWMDENMDQLSAVATD